MSIFKKKKMIEKEGKKRSIKYYAKIESKKGVISWDVVEFISARLTYVDNICESAYLVKGADGKLFETTDLYKVVI